MLLVRILRVELRGIECAKYHRPGASVVADSRNLT